MVMGSIGVIHITAPRLIQYTILGVAQPVIPPDFQFVYTQKKSDFLRQYNIILIHDVNPS